MSLKFVETIKCGDRHTDLIEHARKLNRLERNYWGGFGISEVVGGLGGGDVTCDVVLYDDGWLSYSDYKKPLAEWDRLNTDLVGKNDTIILKHTKNGETAKRKIVDCTLVRIEGIEAGSHPPGSPIDNTDVDQWGSWILYLRFVWRRLG